MSISVEHGVVGLAEAYHRTANNFALLNGVIRLQRSAIGESGKTFTSDQVCVLLDDISARLEVTARLHKSLALSEHGNRVNLGDFLREISEMIGTLAPQGKMDLTFDNSGAGNIDPRHVLHAALIAAELRTSACKYADRAGR